MTCSRCALTAVWLAAALGAARVSAEPPWRLWVRPEQSVAPVRDPSRLPRVPLPDIPPPATVAESEPGVRPRLLSLDEAIRIALANCETVRVLAGLRAASSGRTIYDPAISNTVVDQEQGRFDPQLQSDHAWGRAETPGAELLDPLDPTAGARIVGGRTDTFSLRSGVSQTTILGGQAALRANVDRAARRPGTFPLNPETGSSLELSYTQPLLQGGGWRANLAPIVVARIDTERSYFQLKDSLQELVRGVIEAYWALVAARTNMWARQRQVEQAEFAYQRTEAQFKIGQANAGALAQTRVALANFRADLIAAEAAVLDREAALRNILGLPPADGERLVPVTPPRTERVTPDWRRLLELAEQRRPDIIELKLILEADQQLLVQARNQARPRVDALALYRWNGLEGEMRNGLDLSSRGGQFTDWTLAVNFSVPLGLRRERALLRQRELLIARDRANLDQALHSAAHVLAENLRNLARTYAQYEAFTETREAARINLEQQRGRYVAGIELYLNLLLAITDWGNAVSAQAQALIQYNTELANLERQTGTILETHGVRLYEERFADIGPLCGLRCYARAIRPTPNEARYPEGDRPAEEAFDLEDAPLRPGEQKNRGP